MRKLYCFVCDLLAPPLAPARDKPEAWTEVRSPHFTVLTTSNEKDGGASPTSLSACARFLTWRFHLAIDNGSPIVVLALKEREGFPHSRTRGYLAKGN